MKCEQCAYFEYVERLVYYCHRIGCYLDLTAADGCGSFKQKDDPDFIYFACTIEMKGYDWSLVARWDYLEDVAPNYLVPSWEEHKQ